jgi:hypothetical protein
MTTSRTDATAAPRAEKEFAMRQPILVRVGLRVLLGAATVLCLMPFDPAHAQPTPADVQAMRAARASATAVFLDRARPKAERLAAAAKLGYPEKATVPSLLAIGQDRNEDDAIRLAALTHHPYDRKYLETVLKILNDPRDGSEELDAKLVEDLSRRTTFKLPASILQSIAAAYRGLLDDPRDKVRIAAYRASVANHDPMAIDRLSESLRRGRDFPVPLSEAIDLLDQDGSVKYIGVLRPYLTSTDAQAQAKAVRALAIDPQSRPKIVEIATDARAPAVVRINALRGLARDDKQFADYAIPMIESSNTEPTVRDAAVHSLAGRMNYKPLDAATQVRFARAVEKFSKERSTATEEGRKAQEGAKELHLQMRRTMPAVQKAYELD